LAWAAPSVSEFACFRALPALPCEKNNKNVYISAKSPNLKEKNVHVKKRLKPKNKRVACHDTPETIEARDLTKR
jgi:hypothetical protein